MNFVRVSVVQADLAWEDADSNRQLMTAEIERLPATDLIVLPEMFTTGFSMASDRLAESMNGPTVDWLRQAAKETGAVVCGSVIIAVGTARLNRFLWVTPAGDLEYYDKRHLFRMSTENDNYSPGTERKIFNINGLLVLPQVCYDLRFPVFSRNRGDVDLMLYVANWPAARRQHWCALLTARAIENQAYVVGVNRVGTDGNGVRYSGDTRIVDFNGTTIADLEDRSGSHTVTLGKAPLDAYREGFPAWKDADPFELKN